MKIKDINPGQEVVYIPAYANGDFSHPDCEKGKISSSNDEYVFVKFDAQVKSLGWEGTTAQACRIRDLFLR